MRSNVDRVFHEELGTPLGLERGSRERKGGDFGTFPSKLRRREMPLAIQQRSALVVSRYSC